VSAREYPDAPRVGVGAVVLSGDRVLLVRRGGQPSSGKWSLPGGGLELGETTVQGIERELAEECGLRVRVAGLAGVLDRVVRDAEGRVRYHWVLVDFLAYPDSEEICAGSDAAEARWVPITEVSTLDVTDGLLDMIERAVALSGGSRP
jgi:ADP-ribose pyrophosphatase YjhB (NUDIX family)